MTSILCVWGSAGKGLAHLPPANGVAPGWEGSGSGQPFAARVLAWSLLQGLVPVCRSAGVGLCEAENRGGETRVMPASATTRLAAPGRLGPSWGLSVPFCP